jgi:hypothetical protein
METTFTDLYSNLSGIINITYVVLRQCIHYEVFKSYAARSRPELCSIVFILSLLSLLVYHVFDSGDRSSETNKSGCNSLFTYLESHDVFSRPSNNKFKFFVKMLDLGKGQSSWCIPARNFLKWMGVNNWNTCYTPVFFTVSHAVDALLAELFWYRKHLS